MKYINVLISKNIKLFLLGIVFSILANSQAYAYNIDESKLKESRLYLIIQGNTTSDQSEIDKIESRITCINGFLDNNSELGLKLARLSPGAI